MSNIVVIVLTRLRILLRRPQLMILCVMLPVIFYIFMGDIFRKSDVYGRIPIAVCDEDDSESSRQIISNLKNNEAVDCIVTDRNNALSLLKNNRVEAVYVLNKGLEKNIIDENTNGIADVYYLPGNIDGAGLTDLVASEMMPIICTQKSANLAQSVYNSQSSAYKDIIKKQVVDYANYLQSNNKFSLPVNFKSIFPGNKSIVKEGFDISSISRQSVPGMLLIFTTLFLLFNCGSLIRERINGVTDRIKLSGCSSLQILLGDLIGIMAAGILLTLIQLVLLPFALGSQSFMILMEIMAVNIFYIYCISSLLLFLTKIFKSAAALQSFIPAFIFFIGLLGGCFFSIDLMPRATEVVSRLTPGFWGQDALVKTMLYHLPIANILLNLLILFLFGTLFFAGAWIKDGRK